MNDFTINLVRQNLIMLFQEDEDFVVRLRDLQIQCRKHGINDQQTNKVLAVLAARGEIKQVAIGADMYLMSAGGGS